MGHFSVKTYAPVGQFLATIDKSLSAKMGNSIDQKQKFQEAYMPVNAAGVRAADEARKIGCKKLSEEHNEFKKSKL